MRRSLIPAALSALVVVSLLAPPSGAADSGKEARRASSGRAKIDPRRARGMFVPGEVLVKFRAGVARGVERAAHAAVGARVLSRIGKGIGLGVDHVRLPRGLTVAAAVQRYAASPLVEWAEPNFYRFPAAFPADPPNDTSYSSLWGLNNTGQSHPVSNAAFWGVPDTTTGDSDADMDVAEAWGTEIGDPSVIVAVLDSGVDVNHLDLAANLWVNAGENCGSTDPTIVCAQRTDNTDNDANGCRDDVFGCDFTKSPRSGAVLLENPSLAGFDHGTHVAGTIAAVTNNATGVSGVCGGDGSANSGCKIQVLKFMKPIDTDDDTIPDAVAGNSAAELAAITYARQMGADIINASYGGPSWSNAERSAIKTAGASPSNILFVAAAANDSLDNDTLDGYDKDGDGFFESFSPSYPASYNVSTILAVAASNHNDEYGYFTGCALAGDPMWSCAFTNFGRTSVDVAAPGVDILSTVPATSGTYATFDGTSMATPHVAGVAGLVQARDLAVNGADTLTPVELKNKIMNSVDKTGLPLNTSMNTWLFGTPVTGQFTRTNGRVNALAALTGSTANATPNNDGDIPGAKGMTGSKVTGTLGWPGDVSDFRKKKLTRGKTYRFTLVVPSGRNFDLVLYKASAKEVWQPSAILRFAFTGTGAGNDETFTYRPGSTKTFFIQPNTYYTNGSYTLKVVCIKNC